MRYDNAMHKVMEGEKKIARRLARARFHVLGRWGRRLTTGDGGYTTVSSCRKCGALVIVSTTPGRTTGNAFFYQCRESAYSKRQSREMRAPVEQLAARTSVEGNLN